MHFKPSTLLFCTALVSSTISSYAAMTERRSLLRSSSSNEEVAPYDTNHNTSLSPMRRKLYDTMPPDGYSVICLQEPDKVYRWHEGVLCHYPTGKIASSWNPAWRGDVVEIDCTSIPYGPPMSMNFYSLNSVICLEEPDKVYRLHNGELHHYPTGAIAFSWDKDWRGALVKIDCLDIPIGEPAILYDASTEPISLDAEEAHEVLFGEMGELSLPQAEEDMVETRASALRGEITSTDSPVEESANIIPSAECNVPYPKYIGDGFCDKTGGYNTAECDFDGGDCCPNTCIEGRQYACGNSGFDCKESNSAFIVYKVDSNGYSIVNPTTETHETKESPIPPSQVVGGISKSVSVVDSITNIAGVVASSLLDFEQVGAVLGLDGPVLNLAISMLGIGGSDPVTDLIRSEFQKVNQKLDDLSDQVGDGFNEIRKLIVLDNLKSYEDDLQKIGGRYKELLSAEGAYIKMRDQQFREACNEYTPFEIFRDLYDHACDSCNAVEESSKQPAATHALYQIKILSDYKIQKFTRSLGSYIISGLTEAMFLHAVCLPPIEANGEFMASFYDSVVWKSQLTQMQNGIVEVANELKKVKDDFHENWPSKLSWNAISPNFNNDNAIMAKGIKDTIAQDWDPEYYYEVTVYNTPDPSWPTKPTDIAYYSGVPNRGGDVASYLHLSNGDGKEIHIRYRSKTLPKKNVGNFYDDFKAYKKATCQATICCGEFFFCFCHSSWAACSQAEWYYTAMIEQWNRGYYDMLGSGEGILIVKHYSSLRSVFDGGAFGITNDFNDGDPADDFTVAY